MATKATLFMNAVIFAASITLGSFETQAARYGNTSTTSARNLMPDGSAVTDFVTNPTTVAGSSTWFSFQTAVNHSYVIELINTSTLNGVNLRRFNVEFFDSTGVIFPGVVENFCNPGAFEFNPPTWRRFVAKVTSSPGFNGYMRIKVSNGLNYIPTEDMPFQFRVYDTTLGIARWTINGYTNLVQLHNMSPSCPVNATIVYRGDNGAIVGTKNTTIAAKGSSQVVTNANDPAFTLKAGSVEIYHNGLVGDLIGEVVSINPKNNLVLQWPLLQPRAYGRGALD